MSKQVLEREPPRVALREHALSLSAEVEILHDFRELLLDKLTHGKGVGVAELPEVRHEGLGYF